MPPSKCLPSPWLIVRKRLRASQTQLGSRGRFSTRATLRDVEKELLPATRHVEPAVFEQQGLGAEPVSKTVTEGKHNSKGNMVRLPRAVQAVYLAPLRRQAQYGVPSCDLQMRSYSVRNLEFFADFALRAAYYLNLPASGPVPLPQITERWTVPKSNFIFKKSQENFERKTLRRLVQIKDGHPDTVEMWLAFLRKHAYYGIGMKANIWNYNGLGSDKEIMLETPRTKSSPKLARSGSVKPSETAKRAIEVLGKNKTTAASAEATKAKPKAPAKKV